jgi:antitoxin component of RelBE/YafQ-DinJ toxin-antitoxin module
LSIFIHVMTNNNKKNKTDVLQIRIDADLKAKYILYCEENGFSISKRLRLFIKKELENEKKDIG